MVSLLLWPRSRAVPCIHVNSSEVAAPAVGTEFEPAVRTAFERAARTIAKNFVLSWSQSCPHCAFIWKLETSIGRFDRERDGKKFCSCKDCSEEYLTERAVRWNRVVSETVASSAPSPTRWVVFDPFSSTLALGGQACAKKDSAHWLAPARLIMTQQLLHLVHSHPAFR